MKIKFKVQVQELKILFLTSALANKAELCNNQIDARALIGQSAMVYCPSKPMGKSRGLRSNYYIKAIDHKFLWFIG